MSTKKSIPQKRSLLTEIGIASIATVGASLVTNPLEVVKTRLQLQGELQRRNVTVDRPYRGVVQTFARIARAEGLKGIQAGLSAAILYQIGMNGVRLGIYKDIQQIYGATSPSVPGFFLRSMAAGATAGAIGAVFGSPMFMVKVRLQSQFREQLSQTMGADIRVNAGHQHQIRGVWHGLVTAYHQEGVRGLFRGADGAVPRVIVASATQLATYDTMKNYLQHTGIAIFSNPKNVSLHFVASVFSAVAICAVQNPFDVVSTRLYNQPLATLPNGRSVGALYRNPIDCAIKIVRVEGPRGLYKGAVANWARIAPHSTLVLVLWDEVKQAYESMVERKHVS